MRIILLSSLAFINLFSVAFAEDSAPPKPESTLMAGLGVIISDKPYKGGDTETMVIPMILYRNDRLVFSGTKISYYLIYEEGWSLSVLGAPRFEGYDDDESIHLNGMHDRDATYEMGMECSKSFDWGTLSGKFFADVLGEHNGQEIQLTCKKSFDDVLNVKSLSLTPLFGLNWRSKQLNDYYFGVEGNEATAVRPEYHAGSSTGILASLRVDYPVGQRWSLFGSVSAEWLSTEITDSPIVDEDYMLSVIMGAMYRF